MRTSNEHESMRFVFARTIVAASLGVGLAACAVGPSTKVESPVQPVPSRSDSTISPGARAFLDSLGAARESGAEPSGEVVTRPEAVRRADTTAKALPKPAPLELDRTRDLAWLDVLRDPQLVALWTARWPTIAICAWRRRACVSTAR